MPWRESTSSPFSGSAGDEPDNAVLSEADRESSSGASVLFSGDRGALPVETRRLFVHLLLGPYFDGRREPKQWLVLLRDEAVLRSRLHELFLELVIAHNEKVAFVRQVVADGLDAPILLRRLTLTFVETALLLYLRQRLTQASLQGERAVVSRDELIEHLAVYERERNPDQARYGRQCSAAIDKAANTLNLLRKLRNSGERYEVSPTLALLFPAEEILALLRTYQKLQAERAHPNWQSASGVEPEPFVEQDPEQDESAVEAQHNGDTDSSEALNASEEAEVAIAREFAVSAPAANRFEGLDDVWRAERGRADRLDGEAARVAQRGLRSEADGEHPEPQFDDEPEALDDGDDAGVSDTDEDEAVGESR